MDHLLSNNLNPPHPFDRRRCLFVLCGVVSASAAAGLDHEPRTAAHKQDMVQYCTRGPSVGRQCFIKCLILPPLPSV